MLLTTGGVYGEDLQLPGALFATFVRSTAAHAWVTVTNTAEARRRPGVRAVITAADLDIGPLAPPIPLINPTMVQPLLARGVVRFVGEPVAVVLSEDRASGLDAAEHVYLDYEPLACVVDPLESLAGTPLLFPDAGTNVAVHLGDGPDPGLFEGCEIVVHRRIVNQRVAPCPLEVRSGAASWGSDGRLTQWASTQNPHANQATLAALYGLAPEQVRVCMPDVGGSFGARISLYPEELLLGWLSRRVGRPVRWIESRRESMLALGHGRGQVQDLTIGGTRDGRVLAYQLDVVQDAGAYPGIGAFLPAFTNTMAAGAYDIPRIAFRCRSVVTNTTPVGAYRGAGRPEAAAAIERAMDLFAAEAGLDAVEVRRRNLIGPDSFPHRTATGAVYDSGDYGRALDLALRVSGYRALRAEQARRRGDGDRLQLGVGVSVYVEITNGAGALGDFAAVEVTGAGQVTVFTGSSGHGQGHDTSWSMLAAVQLGVPLEAVAVVAGDTDAVASGGGTMASRSLQAGGVAVWQAAEQLVEAARRSLAAMLGVGADDVALDRSAGRFEVAGQPGGGRSWAEVAAACGGSIRAEARSAPTGPSFPFGAHVAVVEVDTDTGRCRLERLVAVDDAGRILNPLLADGQRHGGMAQGAAQALLEEVRYDGDGNPLTSTLAEYAMISAAELPSFELVPMETLTTVNQLGVKGIGESGAVGATPAVQSAVVDALAHLGVRHVDLPATPERVWAALRAAPGL